MQKQSLINSSLCFLLCFISSILFFSCQKNQTEETTIDLGNLSNLSQAVYKKIKPFNVIMVGEMHGTEEPAKLVGSLAKLIAKNEEEVYVGLEISEQMINLDNDELNAANILNTDFFSRESFYGRNSEAWFNLLVACGADERIKVFYYDNHITDDRDSSMYLGIKKVKELHPTRKIITLSGNVHNMLIPSNGKTTMGWCIMNDSLTFNPSTVMSIYHLYKEGTMINDMGNSLELHEVKGINLSDSSKYKNFLSEMFEGEKAYNYFFYTEKVNHSEKVKVSL